MSATLFDDIFTVLSVETDRYDRVARFVGQSTTAQDIRITLDINSELFPVQTNDSLTITLAKSLAIDEDAASEYNTAGGSWRPPRAGERTLADDYDYVMHGTVYKFEEGSDDKISVYVSFGGLLMCLEGGYRSLSSLKQENVFILVRH